MVLIAYSTRRGTARRCAEYLEKRIKHTEVIDLTQKSPSSLATYDRVIVIGSVYAGKVSKAIIDFVSKNKDELVAMESSLVLCCGIPGDIHMVLKNNFEHAETVFDRIVHGGYAYYFEELNFLERMIVKKLTGNKETVEKIEFSNLDGLII